jgi:hypothetical protein
MKTLWALFIIGQILSAGNMNYQQEQGYYEVNPLYSKHPSKEQVYLTKGLEIAGIWGATRMFPKHKKKIVAGANIICWGFIIDDRKKGIAFKFRF